MIMPPRKSKGRGKKGAGRGRDRAQQEARPGRANETESLPVSEPPRPSLSQAPAQPKCSPTSQKKEQKTAVVNPTPSRTTSPSQSSSRSRAPSDFNVNIEQSKKTTVQKEAASRVHTQLADESGEDRAHKPDKAQGSTPSKSAVENLADVVAGVKITHDTTGCSSQASDLHPPQRPGFGTAGKPIRLFVNFFRLKLPPNQFMYHYDVEIEPSRCPRSIKHRVIDALLDKYSEIFQRRRPAFDGQKNIYSRESLPVGKDGIKLEVELPDEDGGKSRKYKVTIKFAAHVNHTELTSFLKGELPENKLPQECVQSLDIVLRQKPNLHFTPVGRSFFPPPGSANNCPVNLGGGCEVWSGYYQSVRPSQWKTMLVNIDVSAKGFYKEQEVLELLCETVGRDDISDRRFQMDRYMRDDFTQAIKGLRIVTTHIKEFKRKYTVKGLSRQPASTLSFTITDGKTSRTTTVEKYFLERYQIRLRYPHLPCLDVGQEKFIPIEVCRLIPCPKRKLTDDQISEMIKHTATPAWERKKAIENWAAESQKISKQYLCNEFGMAMNTRMEQVEGRVLNPPTIKLGNESKQQQLTQHSGFWDMREKTFFKSETEIKSWAMFCYVPERQCKADILRNFSKQLMVFSGKAGMRISMEPCVVKYIRKEQTDNEFDTALKRHQNLQLIVAVVPNRGNKDIYEQVKQVGDVILGVATQCVQFKQVQGAKAQVCSNIAMKINAKMGGVKHVPVNPDGKALLREPTIIFGADVTHPAAGDTKTPSIAAVVATLDPNASRYCATVRVQDHRQEIIEELATMVKELMKQFRNKTSYKPTKIIFYRDGVSEGQFDQVLKYEVRAVQQACSELENGYQPRITFVVVQKRHHVRLFPANKEDQSGKKGNVPPGTTVDRGITHPFEFDFYLCSHFGIQGTSKPTHYHVIYDDNSFDADSLQRLTYQLCHTFARCPRSVSMPAPAYYAHLAAFRARNHLAQILRSSNGSVADNLKAFSNAVRVKSNMASEMYFI